MSSAHLYGGFGGLTPLPHLPGGNVRRANRSWWMEEALAADPGAPCPPLLGSIDTDVIIVGGGYTGLWTALFIKEQSPHTDVVLLERDICGAGPSGRNGGFLNAMWDKLYPLSKEHGDDVALRICKIADRSISGIGQWCEQNGVDAWYDRNGDIGVSTSPAQDGSWTWTIDNAGKYGVGDLYSELSRSEVQERVNSPLFRGGMLTPGAAHVQPARLARGLRRVALERGVRIFEGSEVTSYSGGATVLAQSPNGKVNGRKLVLATGAYAAADRNFSRKILPLASYVLVTEPAPDRLAEIGWVGGEGVYDYRWALRYVRTTPDGRIAFGSPMYGPGLRPRVDFDAEYLAELSDALVSWFPNFKDVGIECGWGGPIDSTAAHVPFFGTLRAGNVHYAMGFMGEGIGPTHFAGRVLSGMALGIDDEYTRLPLIGVAPRSFPIKAVLAPGAAIAYRSIVRKDRAEDRGESPSRVTEFMAGLPARFGY